MQKPSSEFLISVLVFLVIAVSVSDGLSLSLAFLIAVAALLYFTPAVLLYVIAEDPFGDFPLLNLLLAWTGLGWVILLTIAMLSNRYSIRPPTRGLPRSREAAVILKISALLLVAATLVSAFLGGLWFVGDDLLLVGASIVGNEAMNVFGGMSFFLSIFSVIGTHVFIRTYQPWTSPTSR
jgi:hypothetical protein